MELPIIEIKNVKKKYILGNISTGTLTNDIRSWWARLCKKEDPNTSLFEENRRVGNKFMALNNVSFNVQKGETIGIVGGNGAGKSTLLKILSRITTPTSGEVVLRGRITSMLEVGTGFNPEMTGRENIYMNGAILGMSTAEIDAKIDEIIEFSEVHEFIDTPVKRYSSGMYVKLAFSVSAHLDSEILIMDEVLAVGDIAFQQKCIDKMQATAEDQGRTILFVSHGMSNVKKLCQRCIVLKDGKLIFDGNTAEGIAKYTGVSFDPTIKSISEYEEKPHSTPAQFKKLAFLNGKNAVFSDEPSIDFSATIVAFQDAENVKFRTILKSFSGDVLGMGIYDIGSIVANKEKTCSFSLPIDNITNDKYFLDVFVGEFEGKTINNFDTKGNALAFEIKKSQSPYFKNWLPPHWGYFDLNLRSK